MTEIELPPDRTSKCSDAAGTPRLDLPPKPAEPLPGDCCGGGCAQCVFEVYQRELELWQQRVEEILAARNSSPA